MTDRYAGFITGGASTQKSIYLEETKKGGLLRNISRTVLIIASAHDVAGIKNMIDIGYPEKDIRVLESGPDFVSKVVDLFYEYRIDIFHMLGYVPLMPEEIVLNFIGLNQHLGPGGTGMMHERRVYAHMRFCREVGRILPIQVYCQRADPIYDAGKVVTSRFVNLDFGKTPEENGKMLLPIEHEVQMMGRIKMYSGFDEETADYPVKIAQNPEEAALLERIKKDSIKLYPRKK